MGTRVGAGGIAWLVGTAVAALCLTGTSGLAQQRLVETDVSFMPLVLQSRSTVYTWESEGVRVFAAPDGGEVRQGDVRVSAPRLVVWLDKREPAAGRQVLVRVYAEGAGGAGQEPALPAHLVEGGSVRTAGFFYMLMRSRIAFSWDCPLVKDVDPQSIAVYVKAAHVTGNLETDSAGEIIPTAPPSEWQEVFTEKLMAEEISFFSDEEKNLLTMVYMGDVRGTYRNVRFNSDAAVVWVNRKTGTYEVYARGNVRLAAVSGAPGPQVPGVDISLVKQLTSMRADEIYLFPERRKGLATGAEVRFLAPQKRDIFKMIRQDVYVVKGRKVYVLDSENLIIHEGSFTTDPFGHPHYKITGQRVRVVRQDPSLFVTISEAALRVGAGEARVLGHDYFAVDLGSGEGFFLSSVGIGSSSKFGPFIRTRWRPGQVGLLPGFFDGGTVALDYYMDRGPAAGTKLRYSPEWPKGSQHMGEVWAYTVSDSAETDSTGRPVPKTARGLARLRHRVLWNEQWRTDAEGFYLSDEGFLREYFEDDFNNGKPPETYLLTRYRKDNLWAGLLGKARINSFLNQTEELSGELQWIALPLGGGFVYNGALQAGFYRQKISDLLATGNPPSLWRTHTEHRLGYPFNVGFLRVDPFVKAFGTHASRGSDAGTGGFTDSVSRLGGGGGVRVSTDLSRSYNLTSELLQLNRLRHVVTPYVELESIPLMSAGSEEFIQLGALDPWPFGNRGPRVGADHVDAIDKRNEARVGIRQRLQTMRRQGDGPWQPVDWMELDMAAVVRSDQSVAMPQDDNYLEADFAWHLTPNITLSSSNNRLSLEDGIDVFNLGLNYERERVGGISLGYDFVSKHTSTVSGSLWAMLGDRHAVILEERLDLDPVGADGARNMESLALLRWFFQRWALDVGVRYDRSSQDTMFLFGFMPVEMAKTRRGGPLFEVGTSSTP